MKTFTTKAAVITAMRAGAVVDVNYHKKERYVVKDDHRIGRIGESAYLELVEAGVMVLVAIEKRAKVARWWRYRLEETVTASHSGKE